MTTRAGPPTDLPQESIVVTLPDDASAPRHARTAVRDALVSWGLTSLADDAQLAVSELVTNALRYGLPPVTLGLHRRVGSLSIDVSDMRPSTAYRDLTVDSEDDDESGRGRGIVEAVSDDTGFDETVSTGKRVYVSWAVPPASD